MTDVVTPWAQETGYAEGCAAAAGGEAPCDAAAAGGEAPCDATAAGGEAPFDAAGERRVFERCAGERCEDEPFPVVMGVGTDGGVNAGKTKPPTAAGATGGGAPTGGGAQKVKVDGDEMLMAGAGACTGCAGEGAAVEEGACAGVGAAGTPVGACAGEGATVEAGTCSCEGAAGAAGACAGVVDAVAAGACAGAAGACTGGEGATFEAGTCCCEGAACAAGACAGVSDAVAAGACAGAAGACTGEGTEGAGLASAFAGSASEEGAGFVSGAAPDAADPQGADSVSAPQHVQWLERSTAPPCVQIAAPTVPQNAVMGSHPGNAFRRSRSRNTPRSADVGEGRGVRAKRQETPCVGSPPRTAALETVVKAYHLLRVAATERS